MNAPARVSLRQRAVPSAASVLRAELRSFLGSVACDQRWRDDVLTAVGEAVANAVEHAYDPRQPGEVSLVARNEGDALIVEVRDTGRFQVRDRTPGRGHGLSIMHAIADSVSIEKDGGTRICLTFRRR
jgi:anti-sigma regulatory factor (Ser/Thr protein kinase)